MIVAMFNPKGGVGKTTTAVNVASVLAARGQSVLLVDLEADMNASISLGVCPSRAGPSIAEVLLRQLRAADAVVPVDGIPNLHLIAGSPALAHMDAALRHARQPERRLADVIRPLAPGFDVVILDSPSSYSTLALSVPQLANHLVVPVRADYLSLESLAYLLRWYRDRRGERTTIAAIAGILLTMVDHRRKATREIIKMVRAHNRRGVFTTVILDDPLAAEAPSHGLPVVTYKRSRAAAAYHRFASELLRRLRQRAQ